MSLIVSRDLSKSYASKLALKQVNLTLDAGSPIALVGPNGAGKTTLLSLLCGFIHPSSGEIKILGKKPGDVALLGRVSALPQDAQLDPNLDILTQLTLLSQLQGFSQSEAKNEALRVLTLMDMAQSAKLKPKSLSHGMSKRVAIAQSLIGSPELVLLDEPTAGIDPVNAKKIRELVKALSHDITFVISSHNLDELEKLCDRVLYIEDGVLSQSITMSDNEQSTYLTLTMEACDANSLINGIKALDNVVMVTQDQDNQFIISHNSQNHLELEIALLHLLKINHWQYKALLRGRTLEQKLFS